MALGRRSKKWNKKGLCVLLVYYLLNSACVYYENYLLFAWNKLL